MIFLKVCFLSLYLRGAIIPFGILNPKLSSDKDNVAFLFSNLKSQLKVCTNPPATACPFITHNDGTGIWKVLIVSY